MSYMIHCHSVCWIKTKSPRTVVINQCLKGRGDRNIKQRLQRVDKIFLGSLATSLLRGKAKKTGQKGFKLGKNNKVFSK